MPKGDHTGPLGFGPGSGWGRGPCGSGLRRGRKAQKGFGFKRFFDSWVPNASDLEAEEKLLKEELAAIQEQKKTLKK